MPSDPNQPLIGATRRKRTREMDAKEMGVVNGLLVLRKVDASGFTDPGWDDQIAYEWGKTYFELDGQGTYINDDFPRSPGYTTDIMDNTLGFGVFDKSSLRVLATYRDLERALRAAGAAQVTIKTDIQMDEADESENPTSQLGRAAKRAAGASA